jgi:hypothetical protein
MVIARLDAGRHTSNMVWRGQVLPHACTAHTTRHERAGGDVIEG